MHHRFPASVLPFAALVWPLLLTACGGGGTDAGATNDDGDDTPPVAGTVADGWGSDIDEQSSTTSIIANWSGFHDDTAVTAVQWAIGTAPGGTQLQGWTDVGSATSAENTTVSLVVGATYYVSVRASDAAGNVSEPAVSDGVTVTGGGGNQTLASNLSQWGITWRFAREYPVGRFANGDPWIVGPIDVVEISPHTQTVESRVINGSMLNPGPGDRHGYDSQLYGGGERYESARNVAIGIGANTPLRVPVASSLVSVISQMGPSATGSYSQLRTAAVLTVLASAPPADAFRPPYAGTDKAIRHRERDLDYSRLGRLDPIAGIPTLATIAGRFQRVWLDHQSGWSSRFLHPVENMSDYGRDLCADVGSAALLLNLDYTQAQKRDLMVRLVQLGIDNWRLVQLGYSWEGNAGHGSGRKFPILFAGHVLGDSAMAAVGTTHGVTFVSPGHANNRYTFGEDCQTFYVQETAAGVFNWGHGGYTAAQRNLPEFGVSHVTATQFDQASWSQDPQRRCCTANAWSGQALAMRVMGLMGAWNHPAFFDYMDRYMATETGVNTRAWETWHATIWDTYRRQF